MTFLFSLHHCEQFLKHLNNLCVLRIIELVFVQPSTWLTAIETSAAFLPQIVRGLGHQIWADIRGSHCHLTCRYDFFLPHEHRPLNVTCFLLLDIKSRLCTGQASTLSLDYTSSLCFFFETRSYYYTSMVGLELALQPRLAWMSTSSQLCLPSVRTRGVQYHIWFLYSYLFISLFDFGAYTALILLKCMHLFYPTTLLTLNSSAT